MMEKKEGGGARPTSEPAPEAESESEPAVEEMEEGEEPVE